MVACACALPRLQVNVPLPKLHFRGSTLNVTVLNVTHCLCLGYYGEGPRLVPAAGPAAVLLTILMASSYIRGHQQDNEELVLSGLLREASEAAVCLSPSFLILIQEDRLFIIILFVNLLIVKAPEPSASSVPLEERQTSFDLKTDPSAVLFTPAETLQIAIHKAAIKASLSRQITERNIGDPSSPSLAPQSQGANKKTHPLDGAITPEKANPLVEAVQKNPPQLIRAKTSPKLTPPASAFNFKSAPVVSPPSPPVTNLPEAPLKKAADPPVAPVESESSD
ncbi:hypothetical protein DAPPUDRAFT_259872 [Daphnia pulex]|uniref:Uncharacterized protein n=1 Tax=Daphnia pulex TaxID=6669 RepID=E9HI20_DAPPU|nr:hypothetical protein DAPPUDRAFT_259872 [Daphnia pulex]|eukprot:EFX68614.1 hypothetical protein DAPPUDRAFT_259872 [Daphnia pulex]